MLFACTQGRPGNVANITNATVPTGAYMEVQETSQNRPVKVKLQICFPQAMAQKVLVQQNQPHYPPEGFQPSDDLHLLQSAQN